MTMILSVIGNPKSQSKTSQVASEIAKQLGERLQSVDEHDVLELAPIGSQLFEWGNEEVEKSVGKVLESDIIVIATPTYKATYTGLLKAFLDQIPQEGLNGKIAIPVMIGAAPHHSMAPDVFLTPLLLELGASCPIRGLYVMESDISNLSNVIKKWLDQIVPENRISIS